MTSIGDPPTPPPLPGHPPPPQPIPAVTWSADHRYVLVPPSGGNDWWDINDIKEDYAVVTVQDKHPNAQRIAEVAFELICSADEPK